MNAKLKTLPLQERIKSETATRVVAIRDSSIATLAAHGLLDADQVSAALHFRDLWERYISLSRPAIAFERIDRSLSPDVQSAKADAKKSLARVRSITGVYGFQLLSKVCGDGFHIRDLYQSRRERDMHTDLLRILLSQVASDRQTH